MSEWIGVIKTTTQKFTKGAEDATIRKRLWVAITNKFGRIVLNSSGHELTWQLKVRQHNPVGYDDGDIVTYSRHDLFERCSLPWRGKVVTDMMTEKERLMNKGTEALIRRYSMIAEQLMSDIRDDFGAEFYVDGEAVGNSKRMHGIESFMGTGTTVGADIVAKPDDSYAGHATDVQTFGGSWSANLPTKPNANLATDWPHGNGDSEYDAHSPLILNYTSSGWGTQAQTWRDNCETVISFGALMSEHRGGSGMKPRFCVLGSDLRYEYEQVQRAKQRVLVPAPMLVEMGFDGFKQNGVEITSDYDCPAGVGYMLNPAFMEMHSLDSKLFVPDGPFYDENQMAYKFSVHFFGNICFRQIKPFVKFAAVAS